MTDPTVPALRTLDSAAVAGRASTRPSLVLNAVSNWAGLGTNVIVGLLLTPIVIRHLGTAGYGIWILIGSVVGYAGLLDLGVSSGVSRYVARYAAQRDYDALNSTVSTALAFFSAIACTLVVGSFLLGPWLATFFQIRTENVAAFYNGIRLLSLGAGLNMIGQVFRAVVVAHERFVLRNCVVISATLLRAALTVWTLNRGLGLVGVAVSYLASDALSLAVFRQASRGVLPALRPRVSRVSRMSFNALFAYGVPAAIAAVAHTLRFDLDTFVVGRAISVDAVAVYAVAATLIRYFINGVCSATSVLGPRFTVLQATGSAVEQQRLLLTSLWLASALASGIAMVMVLAGGPFLRFWVGPAFDGSALVLWLLAVPVATSLGQDPAFQYLFATNQHRFLAMSLLVEGCVNVVLSVLLARSLGLVGVAIGTAIPLLANNLIVQPLYVCRVSGISLPRYYLRLTPWLAAVALLLVMLVTQRSALALIRLG